MSGAVKSIGKAIGNVGKGLLDVTGVGAVLNTLLAPKVKQPQQAAAKPVAPMSDDRRSRRAAQRRQARARAGTGRAGTMLTENEDMLG